MSGYDRINRRLKLGDSPEGLTDRLYYRVRTLMLPKKAKIVESHAYRKEGSLLNYGAKTGFFSHHMERRGWKVTSVEKSHEERLFSLEMFHHRMIEVPDTDSVAAMRSLTALLGRKVGPSTGTNFVGMLTLAQEMRQQQQQGSILSLLCDAGERYLPTYHDPAWVESRIGDCSAAQQRLQTLLDAPTV